MKVVNRIARGAWMLGAFGLVVGLYACAAPDAQPNHTMPKPDGGDAGSASGGAGGGGGGSGGSGGNEPPTEPLAGVPQWAQGFGGPADQRAYDLAYSSKLGGVAATIGFYQAVVLPGGTTFTVPSSAPGLAVAKFGTATGTTEWAKNVECTSTINRSVVSVDGDGNVIVAGGFNGTMTIGMDDMSMPIATTNASNFDAFIAKYDATGKPLWVRSFGEFKFEVITDVATDKQGNIIVVGVTEGSAYEFGKTSGMSPVIPAPFTNDQNKDDLFVAKFDPAGNAIWAKRFGTAGGRNDGEGIGSLFDPIITVAVSQLDDSILVGGSFSQEMLLAVEKDVARGKDDGFVAAFDTGGNRLWHVTFGDDNSMQRVRNVAFTSKGEALFTGSFQGMIDVGGTKLTSYKASEDLIVGKLDKDGKPVWVNGYGLMGKQQGTDILVDAKDQPIVFGTFNGAIDFAKDGGSIVDTNVSELDKTDLFIAKFGLSGNPFWARAYGDVSALNADNQDTGGAVLAKDGDTNIAIIAGMNRASMDIKPLAPLTTAQIEDAFLIAVTY